MRKRKHPKHLKLFAIVIIISVTLTILAVKTEHAVRPVAKLQACHYAEAATNRIIEKAVSDYIEERDFSYSDFAAVLYDESGRVVSVECLVLNINRYQAGLSLLINRRLEKEMTSPAKIPLGSVTGSYFLTGKGPELKIRICPARKAEVKLISSFTSAGNNQTCHRISAVINVDIRSSLPLYDFETSAEFEFLLAENIIIGEVPDVLCD